MISIPFIIVTFFDDAGLGASSTLETIWDWIMVGIHATIAGALITRKSWSRHFVIGMSIIGLTFGIINVLSKNMFAIFSVIISVIVIECMRKDHVKAWLNDQTP